MNSVVERAEFSLENKLGRGIISMLQRGFQMGLSETLFPAFQVSTTASCRTRTSSSTTT